MQPIANSKKRSSLSHVVVASTIGTSIEWYDWNIYGIAAAFILGAQFFPKFSPIAGTIAAFATFGVGYLSRPIGAVIFGHIGDRSGRKAALVGSLLLTGIGTFAVGLLPNYDAIGIWAPILLVAIRFIQGIGIGGEWGGAVLLTAEYSPGARRGFLVGFPQLGSPIGLFLANATFLPLKIFLPAADFAAWGWRIPFLLSIALVIVGLIIRLKLFETPVFESARERNALARVPVITVLRSAPKTVLLVAGAYLMNTTAFNLVTAFVLAYGSKVLGISNELALTAQIGGAIALGIGTMLFSGMSDRYGRKRIISAVYLSWIVWVWPMFWLIDTRQTVALFIAVIIGTFLTSAYGPLGAFLIEQFDTNVRYTGASIGQQLGAVVGGGLGPVIALTLQHAYGTVAVAAYACGIAIISVACTFALREASKTEMSDLDVTARALPLVPEPT